MDSNRSKRRSLISKSKQIMSLYRATKPSSAALLPYTTKPSKPSHTNSAPTNSVDFVANYQPSKPKAPPNSATAGSALGFIIVNQDQCFPQQTPKVAFVVKDRNRDSYGKLESIVYGGGAEDEAVDAKAAKYISSVQERFRLERVNSERKNFEDLNL